MDRTGGPNWTSRHGRASKHGWTVLIFCPSAQPGSFWAEDAARADGVACPVQNRAGIELFSACLVATFCLSPLQPSLPLSSLPCLIASLLEISLTRSLSLEYFTSLPLPPLSLCLSHSLSHSWLLLCHSISLGLLY